MAKDTFKLTEGKGIKEIEKAEIRSNLISQPYKYLIETNYRNSLGITKALRFCFITLTIALPIIVIGLLIL